MKAITRKAIECFNNNTPVQVDNTHVTVTADETSLYLFGNKIAKRTRDGLYISNAGWRSNTTKERLNGFMDVSIYQKAGQWYLNNEAWDGKWIKVS